MQLTPKLLGHLNRVFNKDPESFQAVTIDATDPMTWTVSDAHLHAEVPGNPGMTLDIDLLDMDLQDVVDAAQGLGYTASLSIGDGELSAMVLIDASGVGAQAILGFRSLLWVFMNAAAYQLQYSSDQIDNMLDELRLDHADGEWLEYWLLVLLGGLRLPAETDPQLLARIISTVLRIKSNNIALEQLVLAATGVPVQVVDIPWLEADNVTVDPAILTKFSLSTLPSGKPAWGNPANLNVLQCAFGVLFPPGTDCTTIGEVMALINQDKAAGTYAIVYQNASAMKTNTLGDKTNTLGKQVGPAVGTFAPKVCP